PSTAPLTVSRASWSLSLASALPCWAWPSASVSLSPVSLPRPSLAWPPSLSLLFSNFSSVLIADLLGRVDARVPCDASSLRADPARRPTLRSIGPGPTSQVLRGQRYPPSGEHHVHL